MPAKPPAPPPMYSHNQKFNNAHMPPAPHLHARMPVIAHSLTHTHHIRLYALVILSLNPQTPQHPPFDLSIAHVHTTAVTHPRSYMHVHIPYCHLLILRAHHGCCLFVFLHYLLFRGLVFAHLRRRLVCNICEATKYVSTCMCVYMYM